MFAKNHIGDSEPSNELTVTTDEAGKTKIRKSVLEVQQAIISDFLKSTWTTGMCGTEFYIPLPPAP